VWYDVTKIDPARDRPLEEVREAVVRQWREEEVSRRPADKARELTERLDKGETARRWARSSGSPPRTAEDLARNATKDDLSADAVQRIFATPVGRAGSAVAGAEGPRRVPGDETPRCRPSSPPRRRPSASRTSSGRCSPTTSAQYIAQGQQEIGVQVNQDAFRRAISGGDS
jgi:peptidyl-prolyl cis-trans isomerase D